MRDRLVCSVLAAVVVLAALLCAFVLSACDAGYNKKTFDTVYEFEYGYIAMPNGECIKGKVENWTDFEDGDMIQLKIEGKTYLTHSANVVLVHKEK